MTEDAVVPAWVGYDIGCGVTSTRLNLKLEEFIVDYEELRKAILEVVPVGFNIHTEAQDNLFLSHKLSVLKHEHMDKLYDAKALRSIGTLGGGNHFIEIGVDEDGYICITVHTGSRGFGHAVASYHMAKAAGSDKPKEGHYPYTKPEDIQTYLKDIKFTTWFAQMNRYRILSRVQECISNMVHPCNRDIIANVPHNTVTEVGGGMYVHRKGATEAALGQTTVIPANMRDGVYICVGKGDVEAIVSASHGCGRTMSRAQAKQLITNEKFKAQMGAIVCDTSGKTDEAPDAYKNIHEVMKAQSSCVKVVNFIRPLINVKG
jgi:tRNA-splicing ligase RtcB